MIKSLCFENYKCFKYTNNIEFAPLTILCGTNSSGKSSVLKSILTMKQTSESDNPEPSLLLNGAYVENGTFEDIIHSQSHQKLNSFRIKNVFEIHNYHYLVDTKKLKIKFNEPRRDYELFNELLEIYKRNKTDISKFEISMDFEISRKFAKTKPEYQISDSNNSNDDDFFLQYLNNNSIISFNLTIKLYDLNNESIHETNIEYERNKSYLLKWTGFPTDDDTLINNSEGVSCICAFEGLKILKIIQSDTSYINLTPIKSELIYLIRLSVAQYKGIHFIGPLRSNPERRTLLYGNANSVGVSGEKTNEMLAKYRDIQIPNNFPYLKRSENYITYRSLFNFWFNKFGIGKLSITGNRGVTSIEINNHNISDVGFGVSQILPIIVQAICMNREETLLIEQPEIHLHPKMQLDMADFLIETAKNERNLIVETHSDHIVNRLIHRVMENYQELSKLVKIYYIEKKDNGISSCNEIKIDRYKGIIIEYPDFFTQNATESREIVKTGFKNLMEKQK